MCDVVLEKKLILDLLEYLDSRLGDNELRLQLTVDEETVTAVMYNGNKRVLDTDLNFIRLLDSVLEDIKYKFNLSDGWFNDEIKIQIINYLMEDLSKYNNIKVL